MQSAMLAATPETMPTERRALAIGSHWPFDQWGRFLPEHTTAVSLLHHSITASSWSPKANRSACAKPETAQEDASPTPEKQSRDGDFYLAASGDTHAPGH
jgi:hypothetical protein